MKKREDIGRYIEYEELNIHEMAKRNYKYQDKDIDEDGKKREKNQVAKRNYKYQDKDIDEDGKKRYKREKNQSAEILSYQFLKRKEKSRILCELILSYPIIRE